MLFYLYISCYLVTFPYKNGPKNLNNSVTICKGSFFLMMCS